MPTETTKCPECDQPNGWHKAGCSTGGDLIADRQTQTTIPRWRFSVNRWGASLIFKSALSSYNNVHVIFRAHTVDWGIQRWGYRVTRHEWSPRGRTIHIGLGRSWCFDIHLFPLARHEVSTT